MTRQAVRLRRRNRRPRGGAILLAVLVVIALLAIGSTSFFNWTFTERRATESYNRQVQTRLAAESGVEALRGLLLQEPADVELAGGLYDNPARFRGVLLLDHPLAGKRCRATLLAPACDDGEFVGVRFGVENESARLNLNTLPALDRVSDTAARERLMGLPGMTDAIADAILDWVDADSEPRQLGAEDSYYATLTPPYAPPNGPLESLDQLLLVRDVTPELMYGLDRNRDLLIDAAEAMAELPPGVENTNGEMNRGWSAYLTLYSAEREQNPEGEPKINVNTDDLQTLHDQVAQALGEDVANFVVAYRQGGPVEEGGPAGVGGSGGGEAEPPVQAGRVKIDFDAPAAVTIDNLMRLVGVEVEVVQQGQNQLQRIAALYPDGSAGEELLRLQDYLTVYDTEVAPGRLNINQAPRSLLASLPGMPPEAVEAVLGTRDFDPSQTRPERRHASWLYAEGLLSLEEMQELAAYVTGGGDVYRVQVVGFYDEEGPSRRIEVVIDNTTDTPRVVARQDHTPLGGGLSPAELGAEVSQEPDQSAADGQ